ncbi:hypothetical protein GDO78_011209 [Eleutherodactylus coqui]|uniref:Secreted protein n=1 Tax=Eleutherodactylus coqui TaxID=57060 RepID=A0A8J6F6D6_ELECQ|nr:hypothetical protein GDO78_011209 [Eleutherodactylus coqui]
MSSCQLLWYLQLQVSWGSVSDGGANIVCVLASTQQTTWKRLKIATRRATEYRRHRGSRITNRRLTKEPLVLRRGATSSHGDPIRHGRERH